VLSSTRAGDEHVLPEGTNSGVDRGCVKTQNLRPLGREIQGRRLDTMNCCTPDVAALRMDPMTTAAAIDRVVHHAVVLEFTGPSVRAEAAEQRAALIKRDASLAERP
jgi:hypothetical protein